MMFILHLTLLIMLFENHRRWYACSYTSDEQMNRKYVVAGLIGFAAILGWNVFLIQRDDAMYKAYYPQQEIENLKKPPSSQIR